MFGFGKARRLVGVGLGCGKRGLQVKAGYRLICIWSRAKLGFESECLENTILAFKRYAAKMNEARPVSKMLVAGIVASFHDLDVS